jgi:DNA helicase TIP49 (TBP-interacting protein)
MCLNCILINLFLFRNDENGPGFLPNDLLDRLLIIPTKAYDQKEIEAIVKVRADAEGVQLSKEAIEELGKIGTTASLRYVMQLLTPAKVLCQLNGRDTIQVSDITESTELFLDAKRSAQDFK